MSIKLALLRSGETIISDIKELVSDEKVYGYILNEPQIISIQKEIILVESSDTPKTSQSEIQVSLSPWIVLTSDKQIPIPLDYVVTLVEPIESVKKMYEEKVNVEDG